MKTTLEVLKASHKWWLHVNEVLQIFSCYPGSQWSSFFVGLVDWKSFKIISKSKHFLTVSAFLWHLEVYTILAETLTTLFFARPLGLGGLTSAQLRSSPGLTALQPLPFSALLFLLLHFFPKKDLPFFFFLTEGKGKKARSPFSRDSGPWAWLYFLRSSQVSFLCPSSAVPGHILFLLLRRHWVYFSLYRR